MCGFPIPALKRSREVGRAGRGTDQHPAYIELRDGTTFLLWRRLHNTLFGCVYHGTRRPPPSLAAAGSSAGGGFGGSGAAAGAPAQERPLGVAIKCSRLARMQQSLDENVVREIAVMRYLLGEQVDHIGRQCVMPLLEACISNTHLYVITPLCESGDLLKQVVGGYGLEERQMRLWFQQILLGLAYIHSRGLCHHDLSPENIVVTGDCSVAVVMDFGMAQRLSTDSEGECVPVRDERVFGKFRYMAPEIMRNQEYDGRKADIWSVAVTFLLGLTGEYAWPAPTSLPVESRGIEWSDITHYLCLKRDGAYTMLEGMRVGRQLSREAIHLLCSMLVIDSDQRPSSAANLTRHSFFTAPS